jgi:hypothetical protein
MQPNLPLLNSADRHTQGFTPPHLLTFARCAADVVEKIS